MVGVSPGAAYGGAKRWLADRFAHAALRVAREHGAAVAIFGSAGERAICDTVHQIVAGAGCQSVNFAGAITLDRFIEIAAACRLFLTNDSGPMHIASALGVPTVAIFGATDDTATGPTGKWSRVVRHPVECSPCLLRECPIDHRCMTRVEASDVAVRTSLSYALRCVALVTSACHEMAHATFRTDRDSLIVVDRSEQDIRSSQDFVDLVIAKQQTVIA